MDEAAAAGTPDDLKAWRKAQRTALLEKRAALPEATHRAWSEAIAGHLEAAFDLLGGLAIGFYWPHQGEFDARFALRRWRERGALAALPVVVRFGAPLEFRAWWPGAPMRRGVYDIPFPDATPLVHPQAVLMPPVGFDAGGFRMGYGAGFFDRTLAALVPQPLKIGVAFELSRMPTIHPQAHDVPMDFIVTEAGIFANGAGGLRQVGADAAATLAARIVAERRLDAVGNDAARAAAGTPTRRASPTCLLDDLDEDGRVS